MATMEGDEVSEKTETTWTCSRCGAVEVLSTDKQPRGWIRVGFANPPRQPISQTLGDLCKRCEKRVYAWVNGTDVEEVQKDRALLESLEHVMASVNQTHEGRHA